MRYLLPFLFCSFLASQPLSVVVDLGGMPETIVQQMPAWGKVYGPSASVSPNLVWADCTKNERALLTDLRKWYRVIVYNGTICGDNWSRGEVRSAVERLADEKQLSVETKEESWQLSKKKKVHSKLVLAQVPFLPEGAIKFFARHFKQNPNIKVLEFGSGASTCWIANRVSRVVSVEHDPIYFGLVTRQLEKKNLADRVEYIMRPLPYYDLCDFLEKESFDMVIVDGRNRKGCICGAIPLLKSGGILVLDDAQREYYAAVFPLLQEWRTFSVRQPAPARAFRPPPGQVTSFWFKP